MGWNSYRETKEVQVTRSLLVVPFLEAHLRGQSGRGLDIGCGTGDLTAHVADLTRSLLTGLEPDKNSLKIARWNQRDDITVIEGAADRGAIPAIGIEFDFAFSNCCFCHISDDGMHDALLDLHSTMRPGGTLVFLVPSIEWARRMYSDIAYTKSGITAVPRFGGRQFFRSRQWYDDLLKRCGFELVHSEDVLIPDDERLSQRYLRQIGLPLFVGIVARRVELSHPPKADEAFDIAHDNRKLEIQLFWQRSLFFWGFVAAAFVGYGTALHYESPLSVVFAAFGLVCSVVWAAGNRGSKYWQEYWERKVTYYQHFVTGNIFYDREPAQPRLFDFFSPKRLSVSKLTMGLSYYAVGTWTLLCAYEIISKYEKVSPSTLKPFELAFVLATFVYCCVLVLGSKSED